MLSDTTPQRKPGMAGLWETQRLREGWGRRSRPLRSEVSVLYSPLNSGSGLEEGTVRTDG